MERHHLNSDIPKSIPSHQGTEYSSKITIHSLHNS